MNTLDKFIDGFIVYVGAPFACLYAITMSLLTQDNVALTISIIGTVAVMFLIINEIRRN